MNIFNVLGRGNGNISETNVSAFLGYILNPNEDHGLKDVFLKEYFKLLGSISQEFTKCFLSNFAGKNLKIHDLNINNDYFIQVSLEFPFEGSIECEDLELMKLINKNKKQFVDIVIIISCKDKKSKNIFNEQKTPVIALLIENKTNANPTSGQLLKQGLYASSKISTEDLLPGVKDNIFSIYLTPDGNNYECEWKIFKEYGEIKYKFVDSESLEKNKAKTNQSLTFKPKGAQLLWSADMNENASEIIKELLDKYPNSPEKINSKKIPTVSSVLEELLRKEGIGEIEPWPESTKHAIKSFNNFIKAGFVSKQHSNVDKKRAKCTRSEFYKYCLENRIPDKELTILLKIEDDILEKESGYAVYYFNGKRSIRFYSLENNGQFYLRIELRGQFYFITGYNIGNREIIGKMFFDREVERVNLTLNQYKVKVGEIKKDDILEFIEKGKKYNKNI